MATASDPRPWYADGIRFTCQQSGRCCTNHGDYAYVYLTGDDERHMAEHLGQTLTAFRRAHTRILDGHRVLKNDAETCRFLDGHRCTVYQARPVQCSTWPFWRANLDREVWEREVVPLCQGVGRGRTWSREEIEALAEQADKED